MASSEYNRTYYQTNKSYFADKQKSLRAERRAKLQDLKQNNPCVDCNIYYPYYVMQFDHRPGESKYKDVSQMISNNGWDRILEEISKCDLVCANCHAARTFWRSNGPTTATTT